MAAITTANGIEQTKFAAGGIANMVGKLWHNNIKFAYDQYTMGAADTGAAGLVISMGRLPVNALVLGFFWTSTAQSAAMTAGVQIGGVAATGSADFTDMTSATTQYIGATGIFPYTPLTVDSQITVVTNDEDFVADATATLCTIYVMDV